MPLTTDLVTAPAAQPALQKATQHPFLTSAGAGTLPTPTLAAWLAQDTQYARAYIRFAGSLLSRLRLPPPHGPQTHPHRRALDVLLAALEGIRRETDFFGDVARRAGIVLDDEDVAAPFTRAYIALFETFASPARSLAEGLVVLWATEMCYYRAWSHARSTPRALGVEETPAGRALREELVPNWTSDEFRAFVDECGRAADEVAEGESGETIKRCEEVFAHVLWLEAGFWPEVEGVGGS